MTDPIVDEVRRVRDEHAAKFDYDLDAIFRDIKAQERSSGLTFVSYPPRRTTPVAVSRPRTQAQTLSGTQVFELTMDNDEG